jgi:hypothetical protein
MYKKSFLQPVLLGLVTILFAASCDKDFNELGTDIVGDDHFGFENYSDATIKAYNQKLGPIASNNLPINPLGFYTNPAFGTTQANFVTQVEMASVDPTFNNTDPEDYSSEPGHGPTAIDSVVMEIPYFKTLVKTEDDKKFYVLDSIYGVNVITGSNQGITESKFRLSVYQSNYYLRDLDPNQGLGELQSFYTDENDLIDDNKGALLNNAPETGNNADAHENRLFYFDKREHKTVTLDDDGDVVNTRSVPSMRLHLDNTFFTNMILNAPEGKLANNATFKNYFRGIYFKTEEGANGNMAMLNFKAGKVTIYYKEDKKITSTTTPTFERVKKTYVLNLTGNTISLLHNSQENLNYLNAANSPDEASKLYLKGGEGSISIIDLFGSADTYKYVLRKDGNGNAIDENNSIIPLDNDGKPKAGYFFTYEKVNTPNGVSDELDELRYPAIDPDDPLSYHSTKNRWMINEASLTFNIDTDEMDDPSTFEPGRIFLYDLTNKKAIVDYSYDFTTNVLFPKFNKGIFGGILLDEKGKVKRQREDETGVYKYKGVKYKVRITNYVRNLIKNDSTNIRLGLSVTESISNVGFSKLKTPNSNVSSAPTMSVMNPLGTILYGTHPSVPADKRLKLEIYYTKPNN